MGRITQNLARLFTGGNPHEETDWKRFRQGIDRSAAVTATTNLPTPPRHVLSASVTPERAAKPATHVPPRPVQHTEPLRQVPPRPVVRRRPIFMQDSKPLKILHETAFPSPRPLTLITSLLAAFREAVADEHAVPKKIYVSHAQWELIPARADGLKVYHTGRYEVRIESDYDTPAELSRNQAVAVGRIA